MRVPNVKLDCGMEVLIGGQPVKEYTHHNKCFIEARLDAPQTYMLEVENDVARNGESYGKWPVTPFELRVFNNSKVALTGAVFVDGAKVSSYVYPPGKTEVIKGFNLSDMTIKAFLFTVPRPPRANSEGAAKDPNVLAEAGTIVCKFYPATFIGQGNFHVSFSETHQQLDKKQAQGLSKDLVATTRAGGVVGAIQQGSRIADHYSSDFAHPVGEVRILYKMRDVLERMGIEVEKRNNDTVLATLYPQSASSILSESIVTQPPPSSSSSSSSTPIKTSPKRPSESETKEETAKRVKQEKLDKNKNKNFVQLD